MHGLDRKPAMQVSADQRRVLKMLSSASGDGLAQALLSAKGFDASVIAGLVNRGLATITTESVLTSGKLTAVAIVEITEAGRRALAADASSSR